MRIGAAVVVLVGASALAVPTGAYAAGHAHHQPSAHRPAVTKCKNDGHKYILGKTATVHGKKAKFVGTFERFHPCGEDDGYFTNHKKTITLTLTTHSKIKVFKDQLDPSATKTVTAAKFPHAFRTHSSEPTYRYSGPNSAVKTLREHFVS